MITFVCAVVAAAFAGCVIAACERVTRRKLHARFRRIADGEEEP